MPGKLHTLQALRRYVILQKGKLMRLEEEKKTRKEGATEQLIPLFNLYWTTTASISFEQMLI